MWASWFQQLMSPARPGAAAPARPPAKGGVPWQVDGLAVELRRKAMRTLRITVYPPDGRVVVSAPLQADDEQIRRFVASRLDWIRARQAALQARPQLPVAALAPGTLVPFLGGQLCLDIVSRPGRAGTASLRPPLDGSGPAVLELAVSPGAGPDRLARVMDRWYRQELQGMIGPLLARWEPRLGVKAAGWGLRHMKSRWGSCHTGRRWLMFSTTLAACTPDCIEYVVVHELCHLLEPGHGPAFKDLMTRFLPDWPRRRRELNHRG